MSFTSETVTIISDAGVEAQAVVVSSSTSKIRVNMQGVAMDFRNDAKGNWTAKFSGLSFTLLKQ
jgi:hypothetical protein|tara:strand:- start:282 stop:473 length:192 start_codon:yes stop_codon:yes gene_type:complete